MQEKFVYEYSTIRIVPKVEREEFVNVGLIMFCKRAKFLKCEIILHEDKLLALSPDLPIEEFANALNSFEVIASGKKEGGVIASYEIADRFRWLTAVRSSCIQTSRPRVGLTDNPEATFKYIFRDVVL